MIKTVTLSNVESRSGSLQLTVCGRLNLKLNCFGGRFGQAAVIGGAGLSPAYAFVCACLHRAECPAWVGQRYPHIYLRPEDKMLVDDLIRIKRIPFYALLQLRPK